jgi:uncharacterized membrane protein YccC
MRPPSRLDWIFSVKAFIAAILALTTTLFFDLPRPYWAIATVYITIQPFAGATASKAAYRVAGTIIGAIATVVLVPNLADAPLLFCFAMALWVAVCLYISMLDRTPRGYLFMLAGYTAPLIGFPSVDDPGSIFQTAVARTEEISVGIICASLVSSIVLPQSITARLAARLESWIADARSLSIDALAGTATVSGSVSHALACEALNLEIQGTHAAYESPAPGVARAGFASLRQHMLMALPILAAVADRAGALKARDALPGDAAAVLADMSDKVRTGDLTPAASSRLRARAQAVAPSIPQSWNELLLTSLMGRLVDVIDLRQDLRAMIGDISRGSDLPALKFRYTAGARVIRHRDHGMALRSAISVFAAILLTCAFWIATGWTDGASAPMFAAVSCCFFASQDDPAPAILEFANASLIGTAAAALYLFVLLPSATNYEAVVIMLAPGLLAAGVLIPQPRTAGLALGSAIFGLALIAIQTSYTADFTSFTNSAIAVTGGMWAAAIVTRLMRSVDEAWSAHRLLRINRETLAGAVQGYGARDGAELAALMLDRLALASARLGRLPAGDQVHGIDLMAEVRAGINIVEIRRGRRGLPGEGRHALDRVATEMSKYLGSNHEPAPLDLLAAIDAALDAIAPDAGRDARLGLAGLRRALFPAAQSYEPSIDALSPEFVA